MSQKITENVPFQIALDILTTCTLYIPNILRMLLEYTGDCGLFYDCYLENIHGLFINIGTKNNILGIFKKPL